jgi:hypothetical protein
MVVGLKVVSYNVGATVGFMGPALRGFKNLLHKDLEDLSLA